MCVRRVCTGKRKVTFKDSFRIMDSSGSKMKKKVLRKQKRCKSILLRHEGIESVEYPTNCILVGNGGLICGVQREMLMELFSPHGSIQDIVMTPDKPYAFVMYHDVRSAVSAMNSINGQKVYLGNADHVLYLGYVKDIPKQVFSGNKLPPGLIIIEDFVTEDEEADLLGVVKYEHADQGTLKHRRVRHFGYEFNYSNNNVDKENPLEEKIPDVCYKHLQKLVALGHISKLPDQITVNTYMPGQGIPPHVDTHSAFENPIMSLSLGSQVIMEFSHPEGGHIPVLLPRRSLLIMGGESRYLWKHGITPRKTDVVPVYDKNGYHCTLVYRLPRTSFTFRIIRKGVCSCEYKKQCDSQQNYKQDSLELVNEKEARQLEKHFVTEVYNDIADHFSDTRHKPWPQVASFLQDLPVGSVLLDVGCGNGKYLGRSNFCFEVGCDASEKLAQVCSQRKLQVLVADCLNLPFRSGCADACLCIAVIHHMSTKARRQAAIREIVRVLRPGGRALVYVWALEQEGPEGSSNYLSYSKVTKKCEQMSLSSGSALEENLKCDNHTKEVISKLAIHTNRTHFEQQDVLVPWHKKVKESDKNSMVEEKKDQVYHRYYHVFSEGELESLVVAESAKILKSYYDKGNWCVLFERL